MDYKETLSKFYPLTQSERDKAKNNAKEMVVKDLEFRFGDGPKRKDYERDYGYWFFDPLLLMRLIIFIIAFIMSGFEVFKFMGTKVSELSSTFEQFEYGIGINFDAFATSMQIGGLILAEVSMIYMFVSWSIYKKTKYEPILIDGKPKLSWILSQPKKLDVHFFLGLLSTLFILYANWESGIHPIIAIMPPFFTIGIAFGFEKDFSNSYIEKKRIDRELFKDKDEWKFLNKNPQEHDSYEDFFMIALWQLIRSKNSKKFNVNDIPKNIKYMLVKREIEEENWFKSEIQKERIAEMSNVSAESINNKPAIVILREAMDFWKKGDNPEIRVDNYSVNMVKLEFTNHSTGITEEAKSLAGLKKMVTTIVKGVR